MATLEAELIAERGGAIDLVTRHWITEYAILTAQIAAHDEHGALTTRAMERRHALAKRRDEVAARIRFDPAATKPVHPTTDYHDLSDDELIVRVETLLQDLRARRDDQRAFTTTDPPRVVCDESDPRPHEAQLVTPDPPAPAREVMCEFGCGTISRCHENRATRLDVWQTLHFNDPQEVARRDAEATRLMMAGGGRVLWR